MSSGPELSENAPVSPYAGIRPEELPPVTPPSAGFIVQLFLIPALIVMAVVAVWALFGKLADSESNWEQLVAETGSSNEHRRWRAALGLAQLLRNEELTPPTDRAPLANHPLVVDSLTDLFVKSLASTTPSDDDITHQEFLARMLGALDADEKTLPALAEAISETHNLEVRKSALMSVATIAGRHFDKATGYYALDGQPSTPLSKRTLPLASPTIDNPAILEQLKHAAQDPQPVVRHLAAYALANVSGPTALGQLKVMLLDGNRFAQANAALGLARNGSTDCVPTLTQLLNDSLKPFDRSAVSKQTPEQQRSAENSFEVEQPQIVRNCLRAVSDLWPLLSDSQKAQLQSVTEKLASDFFAADVRLQVGELLKSIRSLNAQPEAPAL